MLLSVKKSMEAALEITHDHTALPSAPAEAVPTPGLPIHSPADKWARSLFRAAICMIYVKGSRSQGVLWREEIIITGLSLWGMWECLRPWDLWSGGKQSPASMFQGEIFKSIRGRWPWVIIFFKALKELFCLGSWMVSHPVWIGGKNRAVTLPLQLLLYFC